MTSEGVPRQILDLGEAPRLFQLSSPSLTEIFIRVAGEEALEHG